MSDVADVGDVLFGRGGLATRMAWTGAVVSAFVWLFAIRRIWRTEPSRHHLIARLLSSATMVLLDVVVVLVFWPPNSALPQVIVSADGARALAAFVVGVQIMAAIWQITAPPRGPHQNRQGPWKLRSMRRRPKVIVRGGE
jgi:hypothetical protein